MRWRISFDLHYWITGLSSRARSTQVGQTRYHMTPKLYLTLWRLARFEFVPFVFVTP